MNNLLLASLILVLAVSACSTSSDTQSSTALACYVSAATPVTGTSQVNLTLNASGGTAGYNISSVTLNGYSGSLVSGSASFSSSVTDTIQFSSATTALSGATGTVTISDSAATAATTSCNFTVGSTTTTSNAISCSITPATTTPAVNQSDAFTFSVVSGGTAPYTFSSFAPGSYGTVTQALTTVSTTQATAAASYSTAGTSVPTVYVTDANGYTGSCSATLTVGSTSSAALACTAVLNPNPSAVGQSVLAYPQITAAGSGGVWLYQIRYNLSSGMTGSFYASGVAAALTFPIAGYWPIVFIIQDSSGNQASCYTYQQVY